METSISALGLAINSVSSAMKTTSSAVRAAEGNVVVLETKMASIEKELRAKYEQCETKLQVLERLVEASFSSLKASNMKVGFTVRFSIDLVTNVGNKAIYAFDKVVSNIGNGYNPQTGIFTASVSGLYVFYLHIMSTNNNPSGELAIEKEGVVVSYVHAEGTPDAYDQGSTSVVIYMEQGQQVWVRHSLRTTIIRGGDWTVFTGFLVQA